MKKYLYIAVIVLAGMMGSVQASEKIDPDPEQTLAVQALQRFVERKLWSDVDQFNKSAGLTKLNLEDKEVEANIQVAAGLFLETLSERYGTNQIGKFLSRKVKCKLIIQFFAHAKPQLDEAGMVKLASLCELYRFVEQQQLAYRNLCSSAPGKAKPLAAIDEITKHYGVQLSSRLEREYLALSSCERLGVQAMILDEELISFKDKYFNQIIFITLGLSAVSYGLMLYLI